MAASLLATKLFIPPARRELVPRPRLVQRMDAGLRCKLTLVSAPAGFGKSTLLGEWTHSSAAAPRFAWLSLDKADNDPTRFWTYFIAALQGVHSELGAAALASLQAPQPPAVEALLTGLINEIAQVPGPLILILDDFHVITAQPVHDALVFLLDHLPPALHLVVAGRADPPWPLARWRARGELGELRANDLRFSPQEAAALLNSVMGLDLSPQDVAALEDRTEGWIVGLQMAAVSMQGRRRASGAHETESFIKSFTGSNRFVVDYLVEEVLAQQPPAIQDFLLRTSILERLTAPLCDAVAGIGDDSPDGTRGLDSRAILEHLEKANLFVVPLDDQREWYRYHHLFADLLLNRLEKTYPQELPSLHLRASRWHEQNGPVADAIEHAFAAGDLERAMGMVTGNALGMVYGGELMTLLGWLETLPEPAIRSRPWLCVAYAWALAVSGRLDAAEPRLRDAEESLPGGSLPADLASSSPDERRLIGHILALRTYIAALGAEFTNVRELARRALEALPADDVMVRRFTTSLLGSVLRLGGDLPAATRAWQEVIAQTTTDVEGSLNALSALASLQIDQGQLHKAAATCEQAKALADAHARADGRKDRPGSLLPARAPIHCRMSALLRERNELEPALQQARECVRLSEQFGQAETRTTAHIALAQALQALGDAAGARDAMGKAARIAAGLSSWYNLYVNALQARLWLALGDVAAAATWAAGRAGSLELGAAVTFLTYEEHLTLAQVRIAQAADGSPAALDEPLLRLEHLLRAMESSGATGHVIEVLVIQALALQAAGREGAALTSLVRALTLAQPEGYVRTFVDAGAPMARLLGLVEARWPSDERARLRGYIGRLLEAFPQTAGGDGPPAQAVAPDAPTPRPSTTPSPLVEPLSARELQVLRLLNTALSSAEIAQELVVSTSTARTHIKSIYAKLDVHGRMAAVQRARSLGLV